MRRRRGPITRVHSRNIDLARGDILQLDASAEELCGRDGLVVRHFVARFVDAHEAEVAVFAHLAVFGAVDCERGVAGCGEFGLVREVHGEGDGLAAEPVAGGGDVRRGVFRGALLILRREEGKAYQM